MYLAAMLFHHFVRDVYCNLVTQSNPYHIETSYIYSWEFFDNIIAYMLAQSFVQEIPCPSLPHIIFSARY